MRELRRQVERKAVERSETSSAQLGAAPLPTPAAAQVFKVPYLLDFLGLNQDHE
ncbi:hypothetical protein OOZ63_27825 [Paucibacter sp. PLA-PC-4]|uniref:hypothetical protein n=1 Tax=Paucibacter sp. PLA-PC-4 TaxID=2993655 RepID=UPI00224AAAD1|nr:hypothetical protein [Paucibacter sp. PLA-PC-4]MCX2865635.1 hypothetical protein [Paucibacter sp. PLA-PC-4]